MIMYGQYDDNTWHHYLERASGTMLQRISLLCFDYQEHYNHRPELFLSYQLSDDLSLISAYPYQLS